MTRVESFAMEFKGILATPQSYPPQEIAGLIKGLLTIGIDPLFLGGVALGGAPLGFPLTSVSLFPGPRMSHGIAGSRSPDP